MSRKDLQEPSGALVIRFHTWNANIRSVYSNSLPQGRLETMTSFFVMLDCTKSSAAQIALQRKNSSYNLRAITPNRLVDQCQ